jgi:hypothetical protein
MPDCAGFCCNLRTSRALDARPEIAQELIDKPFRPSVHYKVAKRGLRIFSWLVFILPALVVMLARVAVMLFSSPFRVALQ